MVVSKALAQQLSKLALAAEQSMESKNPKQDFKDFYSPSKTTGDFKSLSSNSADLQSPKEVSGGNKEAEEEPMDNVSSMDEASKAPKSCTPAELVPLAVLKRLKGTFTDATLDCQLPCTSAEGKLCQIFNHLSAWNEFLCLASLQLEEVTGTSGNLALVFRAMPDLAARPLEKQWHQRHQIYTLVYWLLKLHHCIVHVQIDVPHFKLYSHLLCGVLQENPNVRSLWLLFGDCRTRDEHVPDILSMTCLRELQCAGYLKGTETLLSQLSSLLRNSRSLTTLRISDMTLQGSSVADFFTALGENRSLEELTDSVIGEATPAAQALFARFLKNSTSLKTLSFVADYKNYFCLQWILAGLSGNKSVVRVSFKGLRVDQAAIQGMAKVFAKNEVLRSFTVSSGSDGETLGLDSSVQGQPTESDLDCLHEALVRNNTLEQVFLPIEFGDSKQWEALFEALTMKDNHMMLTIEVPAWNFLRRGGTRRLLDVTDVSAALEATGVEDKVSFKASFLEGSTGSFYSKMSSKAYVFADGHNTPAVCEFLGRLPSLGHVDWLSLHLFYRNGNDEFSSSFITFLRQTRTLKTLKIGTELDLWRLEETIVKGVAINTSLRELCISVGEVFSELSEFSKPLAEAINSSKTISRVEIDLSENQDAVHTFVQNLSLSISNNYTLLSASVIMAEPLGKEAEVYWFQVNDVLRRNRGLVTAAADFVRGVRRDRHCALALEKVHRHPGLVEDVARLESVDEARAAAMVQEGFQTMANMPDFV